MTCMTFTTFMTPYTTNAHDMKAATMDSKNQISVAKNNNIIFIKRSNQAHAYIDHGDSCVQSARRSDTRLGELSMQRLLYVPNLPPSQKSTNFIPKWCGKFQFQFPYPYPYPCTPACSWPEQGRKTSRPHLDPRMPWHRFRRRSQ